MPEFATYEEMYKSSLEKETLSILDSYSETKMYYDIYKQENSAKEPNYTDFSKKWLPKYLDNIHFMKLALHTLTEVDIMKIASQNQNFDNIIEDDKATNSKENAVNTVIEFLKLKIENPDLKKIIVVSEWQYLLRQVLTTQKVITDISMIQKFLNTNNIDNSEKIADNEWNELLKNISLSKNTVKEIIELQNQAKNKGIQNFEKMEILGYPANNEKDIALSCKNISSFINILSTDFGKIQIYQKDTGGYSIPKSNSQLELFDDLFSNIIINQETKKTLKDYLIEEYQKKLEKEEKTVNNNEKRS